MKIPKNKLDLSSINNKIDTKLDASSISDYQEGNYTSTGYVTLLVNGVKYKLLASE